MPIPSLSLLILTIGDPMPPQVQAGRTCQVEQLFKKDVETLASDSAEGRCAGTVGGRFAIEHVARRMRELGLEGLPGLAGGGYLQEFEVPDPRPREVHRERTACDVEIGGRSFALVLGTEFVPLQSSADGDVTAEVVFAGYGIRVPELQYDDYAGLDVKGKIVLVVRGAPRWREPDSRFTAHAQVMRFENKLALARSLGAAAVLQCHGGPPSPPSAQEELRIAGLIRCANELPALWLRRSVAERLFDGTTPLAERQASLDSSPAQGRGPLPCRIRLRVALGPPPPPLKSANVIGLLPGSDPALNAQCVVVAAHHDHVGRGQFASLGGAQSVGKIHPGADDNASGVAGLLETARLLTADRPRRPVLFASFGAEEVGLHGSRHFLENCPVAAGSIVALLNLNMIGRGASGRLRIEGARSGEGLETLVKISVERSGLLASVHEASSWRGDHVTFLRHRIPALLFHTGMHEDFHRPTDVAALVEVEAALRIVGVVTAITRALGNAEERPRFVERERSAGGSVPRRR